jgi:processive 1,2-diacylglycerol beta-glucosyltransferase
LFDYHSPMHVIILSASVGAGHLRAAQAVELALKQSHPDIKVQNIDVLTLTNGAFRRIYGTAYIDLVNKAPHVLGYMYDMLDKPSRSGRHRADRFRLAWEKLNLKKFIDLICQTNPDLVINTHFLPAEIIASLRKRGECTVPQVTVTTDFETHRLWVNQPCEHYFTATEEGAIGLSAWGIPREDITVTGIPIHPLFSKPKDRKEVLKRQNLDGDRPIILQSAGGFGVGPIEKIYKSLLNIERPLEIVVVTGKNAAAKNQLSQVSCPKRHRCQILGFTDQMDELMCAADLVVSKPGGLTTSETLARGAAMVIVDPIPGQESRNSDFLLENGAAIKVNNLAALGHKLEAIFSDPTRLTQLKSNAAKLGRPRAAFDVVEKSLSLVKSERGGMGKRTRLPVSAR